MRVISGKFRGKKLFSPDDSRVRPTADRIKETLFNILYSRGMLFGKRVLDLFSGSGALGIEALSRGATECVFADIDRASIRLTEKNLALVGLTAGSEIAKVINCDYKATLKSLSGSRFDLILADPPYAAGLEAEITALVAAYSVLNPGGILVIEHLTGKNLINAEKNYIIDNRECGNTALTFLTLRS